MSIETVKTAIRARMTVLGFLMAAGGANEKVGNMIDICAEEILADALVFKDHGMLDGLGDDDHTQYLTNARGDARYTPLAHKTTEDAINGLVKVNGAGSYSAVTDNSGNWNTAYGWGNHAGLYTPIAHKTTEDAINGLVKVNGAGSYSAVTDNSGNWNTAYGWGNHAGLYSLVAHLHDGQTLQCDGINSNGGAFSFSTTGAVTFNNEIGCSTVRQNTSALAGTEIYDGATHTVHFYHSGGAYTSRWFRLIRMRMTNAWCGTSIHGFIDLGSNSGRHAGRCYFDLTASATADPTTGAFIDYRQSGNSGDSVRVYYIANGDGSNHPYVDVYVFSGWYLGYSAVINITPLQPTAIWQEGYDLGEGVTPTGVLQGTNMEFNFDFNVSIARNQNASTNIRCMNGDTGGAALSQFVIGRAAGACGLLEHYGLGWTTDGVRMAQRTGLLGYDGGGLVVGTATNSTFRIATNNVERAALDGSGVMFDYYIGKVRQLYNQAGETKVIISNPNASGLAVLELCGDGGESGTATSRLVHDSATDSVSLQFSYNDLRLRNRGVEDYIKIHQASLIYNINTSGSYSLQLGAGGTNSIRATSAGALYFDLANVKMIGGTNYNENIRMHPSAGNDFSSLFLGAVAGDTGTGAGQWGLVRYPSATYNYLFGIQYNTTDFFNITSTGDVGINTAVMRGKLHVVKTAGTNSSWYDNAVGVFEHNDDMCINLRSPNNKNTSIVFSDPDSTYSGIINYNHAQDLMKFGVTTLNPPTLTLSSTDVYTYAEQAYSPTIVGWSSYTYNVTRFKQVGRSIDVWFRIEGESNSGITTMTLPATVKNTTNFISQFFVAAKDNGAVIAASVVINANSSVATFTACLTPGGT